MKAIFEQLNEKIILPLQQWIRRITNKRDDDDNQFNQPWAIL